MHPLRTRSARAGLLLLAIAAACDPTDTPLAPAARETGAIELTRVACTASVAGGTVTCGGALAGDARGIIVGGQGTYVQLTSSAVSYDSATQIFQFDITVQNLIPQPMGTTDGSTPAAAGVRVFFDTPPHATTGSGTITVANEDGQAAFLAAGQDYFQYSGARLGGDGILSSNETSSAKTWQLSVPTTVGTFSFLLYVAADVPYPNGYVDVTPAADSLLEGATQALTATVRTAVGNPVPGASVTWGTSDGAVATVSGSGLVTAVSTGSATITATSGARSGTATIAVCPSLPLGGVAVFDVGAGSSLCLGGGAGGAEYTLVTVNTDADLAIPLGVTGSGIVPVSGPPSPDVSLRGPRLSRAGRAGAALRPDDAFERRLRETARRELAGRPAAAPAGGGGGPRFYRVGADGRRAITPGVPSVGALMSVNVETDNACSTFDTRTGRVQAVGTHIIVMADTMNPAGGLSAANYQAIADSFDTFIHGVLQNNFGAPSDIDGNGRVIAFYTRAVNELTPPASSAYVGGFFFSRDLYPATTCPTSNVGELMYMLAADPAGAVNGNVRSVAFVLDKTLGTLGHEGQHLVNAARRMYVNTPWNGSFEDPWLDEGLAHVAEELLFYARSGLAPNADLDVADIGDGGPVQDAFFRYAEPNFGRLRQWLLAPHAAGPFDSDTDLATRGAAWAFLRYAADRKGGSHPAFWSALVNTQNTGIDNVQAVLGTDPLPWFRDFSVATYADDAAGSPAAAYTQPSWNFRNLFANLDYDSGPACTCAYELAVRNPTNGVADNFTLAGGGASAYVRLGVSASAFAGVTVRSGGVAPPATVRVAVFRRE